MTTKLSQTATSSNPGNSDQAVDPVQIALCRFGLGARPTDVSRISVDPRGDLLRQMAQPKLALLDSPHLLSSDQILRQLRTAQKMGVGEGNSVPPAMKSMKSMNDMAEDDSLMSNKIRKAESKKNKPAKLFQVQMYQSEVKARLERWLSTDTPFLEHLVQFWMNHFTVSGDKSAFLLASVGAYEREAIRPHILGKFDAMLLAVVQHPVMLIYLDNQNSIGPNSPAGVNATKGLNENLAREILELHTLGVDGGYTQADVTAFAKILTGWFYFEPNKNDLNGGHFRFAANRHEPGDITVLGKIYPAAGKEQGENALRDFARHPATARHIATKLARAFVRDEPPQALVTRLETAFLDSGGDLAIVTRTLIEAPESWSTPQDKLRAPDEFVIAAMRAGRISFDHNSFLTALSALGAPLWRAPGPNGYAIDSKAWLAPENIAMRADISFQLAHEIQATVEPESFASAILGKRFSAETRLAIRRAASREQAFALLFMSPEFQRR